MIKLPHINFSFSSKMFSIISSSNSEETIKQLANSWFDIPTAYFIKEQMYNNPFSINLPVSIN